MNTMLATQSKARVDKKRVHTMNLNTQVLSETVQLERWENEGGGVCHGRQLISPSVAAIAVHAEAPHVTFEQSNAFLHRATIGMKRGLLQYASQCSLRVLTDEADRSGQLNRLVTRQQRSIRWLCGLLCSRERHIEWGALPVAHTHFNFVELSFFWPPLVDSQAQPVHLLEAVHSELEHDPRTSAVLKEILQTERGISAELIEFHVRVL